VRQLNETDIRDILPTIDVPTLCIARRFAEGLDEAELVTRSIPGARLLVLEGADHWSAAGDQEGLVGEVRSFLGAEPQTHTSSPLQALLFTDIVDSTGTAQRLGDVTWIDLLARHNALVRNQIERAEGTVVDTAGDGFFATFDGPARAVRCARSIVDGVQALGIQVRTGIHVGEVETIEGKPGGIAVHVAARVSAAAGPSEVLVTRTVKDLVAGSHLSLADAGEHMLKGVDGSWQLYRLTPDS
jgi:class 3 adenylate cyclase